MTPSERRLHPLSFLFAIGSELRGFLLPFVFLIVTMRSATWELWPLWLVLPTLIYALVRYLTFRYAFAATDLVIRTGFLFRNERRVPYARVQNVEVVRNPLHRLLGVAEVRMQTAGGAEPEAALRVLSLAAASELLERVKHEKALATSAAVEAAPAAGAPAMGRAVEAEPARTLVRLGPGDLVVFGLAQNRGMLVIAAVLGVAWEASVVDPAGRGGGGLFDSLWSAVGGRARAFGEWGLADFGWLLAVLIAALAFVRLLSIGWAFVRLHGFTLTRAGEELHVTCGLLTQVRSVIPLRRIQSLTVSESPLERGFGCVSVRVQTAGGDQAASETREWVAPILPRARLAALLAELLPEAPIEAAAWRPVDARARARLLREWAWTLGPPLLLLAVFARGWTLAAVAPCALWAWLAASGQARGYGWALADGLVAVRSGWLWRHTTFAPLGKIQVVELAESPWDRRWRMAGVAADTAGGSGRGIAIPYLPVADARGIHAHIGRAAAATAFRW